MMATWRASPRRGALTAPWGKNQLYPWGGDATGAHNQGPLQQGKGRFIVLMNGHRHSRIMFFLKQIQQK